jgi:hypothetical protein
MKRLYFFLLIMISTAVYGQGGDSLPTLSPCYSGMEHHVINRNQQVLDTVIKYGRQISPTYEDAVCTELVIGVLSHFFKLTQEDKTRVRIDQPRESLDDVYKAMENGAPEPKGVYYALTSNGRGEAIEDWSKVRPGDFVQFWYPNSWGHCGIVGSIDLENKTMYLHSSFPTTGGYGVQKFQIPDYCFFVRLK